MEENQRTTTKKMIVGAVMLILAIGGVAYVFTREDTTILENTPPGGVITSDATVDSIDINIKESFPVQIDVIAHGNFSDGCTDMSDVSQERTENTFNIKIEQTRPEGVSCTQALVPFSKTVSLDVYGLPAGVYTVNVNGVIDTFELTTDNIPQGDIKG
jgi:inhibitor of cysteine peptidase